MEDGELLEDELENVSAGYQDRERFLEDLVNRLQTELSKPRNTSAEIEQIRTQLEKARADLERFKLTQTQGRQM